MSVATARRAGGRGWLVPVLVIGAGPVLYGFGLWAASVADGQPLVQAVCFDAAVPGHSTPLRAAIAVVMAVGAFLLLFATPWLLGTLAMRRLPNRRATAGAWSLAANSAALILVCLLLRSTPVGVNRESFLVAWLIWTVVLFWAAGGATRTAGAIHRLRRRWVVGLLIGTAALTLGIVLFRREHFIQCFDGDGTEQFELARSLRDHFLPYWEIEAVERLGTYMANPTVICSYWTLPWQLLLGETELPTRLPCWVWWLGIYVISLGMARGKGGRSGWLPAVALALALLLTSVWYTFYVGYYAHMTDPASPGVLDGLFTVFLLAALNCLRRGDCAGWVVSMILASLIFYAGPVLLLLTAAAAWFWQPVPRRQLVRATLAGVLVIGAIVGGYLLVGWGEGSLSGWWATLHRECFDKYSAPGPRWPASLLYLGYLLLGCGTVPAIGLVLVFVGRRAGRSMAWDRTVATVALAYLLIILGSGHKNLHYLGPLLPIPLVLWLRLPRHPARPVGRGWATAVLASGGLVVSLLLSWPPARPVFTRNRELGALTTFQTESYAEAIRWGRIAGDLYDEGRLAWWVGEHTWVHYSRLDAHPATTRPLLLTGGAAPPGYELVLESPGRAGRLYSRDPARTRWMASPPSPNGLDRWPRVFRPIATAVPARRLPRP